jgi:hypothetical protein
MTTPTSPADLIAQAAQRHQAARDAAQAASAQIAAERAATGSTEAATPPAGATR